MQIVDAAVVESWRQLPDGAAAAQLFTFFRPRCDRVIEAVLRQIICGPSPVMGAVENVSRDRGK